MLTVTKKFEFEASHQLPNYNGTCRNLHGHTFKLEITVSDHKSETEKYPSMVIDFKDFKKIVEEKVISQLDHKHLNNIFGDEPSTSENIVLWIKDQLWEEFGVHLQKIVLFETSNSFCTWENTI